MDQSSEVLLFVFLQGVAEGELLGEYTGLVRRGSEADDEVSRRPDGIGGFVMDKIHGIHCIDGGGGALPPSPSLPCCLSSPFHPFGLPRNQIELTHAIPCICYLSCPLSALQSL